MNNKEYQREWRLKNPRKLAVYEEKRKKERRKKHRKCRHCQTEIPFNRRICDVCASTAIICCTCGKSAKVLRSKRRYKQSYFCSKKCQYEFFRKTNIWKMFDELQSLRNTIQLQNINEQIIKSQQQQIEGLLEFNQEILKEKRLIERLIEKEKIHEQEY